MENFRCEKMFFRALFFLKEIKDNFEKEQHIKIKDAGWGHYEEDGVEYTEVYLGLSPKNRRGVFVYVFLCFTKNGPSEDGYPLWLAVLRDDEKLWQVLKAEFNNYVNSTVYEDWWNIGFAWPFDYETSLEEIKLSARSMSEAISRAFKVLEILET